MPARRAVSFESLGVSARRLQQLDSKGIKEAFPIQEQTFGDIKAGKDMIGRAHTGTGKTLAFALPIAEKLAETAPGRHAKPRALILVPTRELAIQVAREFETVANDLRVLSVYGGANIVPQMKTIRDGVDVVVGTPGRMIDLLNRGSLTLDEIETVVLDEADYMLDRGFKEDMETILQQSPSDKQTLLFSATFPPWVNQVSKSMLRNPTMVDLVGDKDQQTAVKVAHRAIRVTDAGRQGTLVDILRVFGSEKAIVFTNTKSSCSELVNSIPALQGMAMPLHGDITQIKREATLKAFKEDKFRVLVATDVAARGIDIPAVGVVVHYDIPQNDEYFIHRSGRCGRAGASGVSILLHAKNDQHEVRNLERLIGQKITVMSPPTPSEVVEATMASTLERLKTVKSSALEHVLPVARTLLETGESQEDILAAALAVAAGVDTLAHRSALTGVEDRSAIMLESQAARPMHLRDAADILDRIGGGEIKFRDGVRSADHRSCIFDCNADEAELLVEAVNKDKRLNVLASIPEVLPALEAVREYSSGRGGGGRGGRGGRGRGRGGARGSFGRQESSRHQQRRPSPVRYEEDSYSTRGSRGGRGGRGGRGARSNYKSDSYGDDSYGGSDRSSRYF